MCPHCGKNAPIVNRGLLAFCTACGRQRLPFTGSSVSLAGKPAKAGAFVVSVLGWLVLIGGTAGALALGLGLAALFPQSIAGLAVGLPLGLASLAFGILLLVSGRKLHRTGADAAHQTQVQAILALASHRQGALTARDVALALDLPAEQADAILTQMAKEHIDDIRLDVDTGEVIYTFPKFMTRARIAGPGLRIDASSGAGGGGDHRAAREDERAALEENSMQENSPPRNRTR